MTQQSNRSRSPQPPDGSSAPRRPERSSVPRRPERSNAPRRPERSTASRRSERSSAPRGETSGSDDRIVEDLRQVYAALQLVNLPTWLKLGLTMAQLKALVAIEREGAVTVSGLGADLSIGESAASLLTEQLVRREYAERRTDPGDRRRVLVSVTQLGEDLLAELRHGRRQTLHEWLLDLSDADAAALGQGLQALAAVAAAREAALRRAGHEKDES